MYRSTQKVGISLGFPSVPPDRERLLLARSLGEDKGVVDAAFSREMPDIVEVEYDPQVTTPYRIFRVVRYLLDCARQ
jgi:hypothetical protein